MTELTLSVATAFPNLNKKEGKDADFERSVLTLTPLKYKHFRAVLKHKEADQMHHLMMAITGLSDEDVGEFSPADAAAISGLVYDSMKDYMQLGRKIISNITEK